MKSLLVLALVAFSSVVSLAAQAAATDVSCQPLYGRVDANGISEDFSVGKDLVVTTKESRIEHKGFTIIAMLVQQCGSEGTSCSDEYELKTRIMRGGQSSKMFVQVLAGPYGWGRWSSELEQGRESLMINCDYETR